MDELKKYERATNRLDAAIARAIQGRVTPADQPSLEDKADTHLQSSERMKGITNTPQSVGRLPLPVGGRGTATTVNLICASDLNPEAVDWLWHGWLAAGKTNLFGGQPGTGKTTVSMSLAATVSTGGCWPDGSQTITGNVVIWSGEDDPADTLLPRLILSGAELNRIFFIDDIREGNQRRSFDPARDMEPLLRKLEEVGDVRLLIVDPIVSAIAGDSHRNAEVRRALQPLVDIAASMRCALLGITHFTKGTKGADPVERITGSLAFGALARVVLVAAKRQSAVEDGRDGWIFCRAKSNIGPDDGGFDYDLRQGELAGHAGIVASFVVWGEALEGSARDLLAMADMSGGEFAGFATPDAKRVVADLLANGPMKASDVQEQAKQAGFSESQIQRASKALNVRKRKDGMDGGWVWELPPKATTATEDDRRCHTQSGDAFAPSGVTEDDALTEDVEDGEKVVRHLLPPSAATPTDSPNDFGKTFGD